MENNKPFTVASLREITDQWDREEISYGKMVELINKQAMTQDGFERINATLDRIELIMKDMNNKLNRMVSELDKYYGEGKPSRTITSTYDGEIMYRFKHNDKNK